MKNQQTTVGILIGPQFEEQELIYPYYRLLEAGLAVLRIGANGTVRVTGKYGMTVTTEQQASAVEADNLVGIHIPGGYSPDHVRRDPDAVDLVRRLDREGKPVAAICHGGWVLASAGIIANRQVTSAPAIRDDLVHAGGMWVDHPTIIDGNLVTARKPADLPSFMRAFLSLLPLRAPAMAGV